MTGSATPTQDPPPVVVPEPVDGNALAGILEQLSGHDLTVSGCECAECGLSLVLAQVRVYDRGPGIVARCPGCDAVLLVITQRRGLSCVDLMGMSRIEVWQR
ncbi:DUF6510 family protein [Microlunatus sp. Gsoil 973]|jgi:hypothetical protein|uniref:DUF6510 family protein n=1 Tax=Microlunatus sp. Gsoil 973 TaxID=2672569 RepID=UPI0018A86CB0|nr:DUF6510 family protein [Microlunatus sp. Gsoil 973]